MRTDRLFEPIDGASIGAFRIAYGALMAWKLGLAVLSGKLVASYVEPSFRFRYFGEQMLPVPGAVGMQAIGTGLCVLAVLVALGVLYRPAIVLLTAGIAWLFLLDAAQYLNHEYLILLVGAALCALPADSALSLRSRAARRAGVPLPPLRRGHLVLLLAQVEIVLIYAGLVKCNPDWLAGRPLSMWFAERAGIPVVGSLLEMPTVGLLGAWASTALHLLGAPMLLFRRTRLPAFLAYAAFHLANHVLFEIGVFPAFAVALGTLFFDPDWPRRLWERTLGRTLEPAPVSEQAPSPLARRLALAGLALWLTVQLGLPLRPLLYPGPVAWTEEGHRFSWRMKLRDKRGWSRFEVVDRRTGERVRVDPADDLTVRQASYTATRPDFVLQYAHELARRHRAETGRGASVYATARVSLNGGKSGLLVDPARDLAAVEWGPPPRDWISRGPEEFEGQEPSREPPGLPLRGRRAWSPR